MGMDIYLEAQEFKARREKARKRFYHWVQLRDEAKGVLEKEELQKQVMKWFEIMNSGKNGFFRVSYNDYSISYWLQYNVDEKAKGDWGLELFYLAVKGKKSPVIRSERFRQELLETTRRWYRKAVKLKDKKTYLVVGMERSKNGSLVEKKLVISGKRTNWYIRWLKDLVVFAEQAVRTKSSIYVSY